MERFRKAVGVGAATLVVGLLAGSAANAGVLYENPIPITSSPQDVDAWTINFGFTVADTFTLSSNSTVTSVDVALWLEPGDTVTSVDWAITSDAGGGTSFGSGTAATSLTTDYGLNSFGFDVALYSFDVPDVDLASGTYWLDLQNAVAGSDPVYWDQGGGASQAWESSLGFLTPANDCSGDGTTGDPPSCAESFRVNGTNGVPEPTSLSIVGAALLGAAAFYRRRKTPA